MTKSYLKFSLERLAYVVHGEAADGTAGDGVVRGVEHAENPVSNLGSKCAINILTNFENIDSVFYHLNNYC